MASPTPNKGYTYPAHGGAVDAWDTPLNTNFDYIDLNVGGPYPLTIASTTGAITYNSSFASIGSAAATITLPSSLAQNMYYKYTGVMTNDQDLSFPAGGGFYVVNHQATGGFTLRAVVSGSTAVNVTITNGDIKYLVSNGIDMVSVAQNSWTGATFAGSDVTANISSDQNNYTPTGLSGATCLRLNCTAACSITGLTGGAAGRDLEIVNVGTATIKFPANSGSSTAANRFANTFNLAPGQSIFLRYDATSSLWRPKNIATAFSSCAPASVSDDLLVVNFTGTENTKVTATASEAVLIDASGNAIKFESVSVTGDSTTTGPGGCDTGTRAASTNYFVWLVSDGVNINLVFSTSSSAATVLTNLTTSGFASYIYMKRISWQVTDSSSNFYRIRQSADIGQYVIDSTSNTPLPRLIANGNTGGFTSASPTLSNVSLAGLIPSTATAINVLATNRYNNSTLSDVLVAPNTSWGGTNRGPTGTANNGWPIFLNGGVGTFSSTVWLVLESANIAWSSNNTGAAISVMGWRDSI